MLTAGRDERVLPLSRPPGWAAAEKEQEASYAAPCEESLQAVRRHVAEVAGHASLTLESAKRHRQHQNNVREFHSQDDTLQSTPRRTLPNGITRLPVRPIAELIVELQAKYVTATDEEVKEDYARRIAVLRKIQEAEAALNSVELA